MRPARDAASDRLAATIAPQRGELRVAVESSELTTDAGQRAADPAAQIARWRSPLVAFALAGLAFSLVSGSVLLFFGSFVARRDYWGFVHWALAMLALLPYALYQWRHWLRVRQYVQQTHYRVGLQAFFLVCGTVLTGLVLLPLAPGGTAYTVADLAHMFCGFVFVLLLSAHLTLVALLTTARAPDAGKSRARASVTRLSVVVTLLTCVALAAAIALA